MRKCDAVAAALVILATACSGDTPIGPARNVTVSANRSQSSGNHETKDRPIKGSCDAAVVSVQPLSATTAREVVAGPCLISHLGKTTIYLRQIIDFTTLIGTSEEVTFTAANGDVLRATAITRGTPTGPTSFSLAGTFIFIGGTGRFANATGRAEFVGSADFATGRALLTMRGRITYDANDGNDANDEGESD